MQKKITPPKNQNISWSGTELKAWIEGGLISRDLLAPEKFPQLAQFILENKEKLYKLYNDEPVEYPYEVTKPPYQEMTNTYKLHIIDRATGKIVKILERVENIDIFDGLSLRVKAKEVNNWRKKTENIKRLSEEQTSQLKTILERISASGKDIGIDELDRIIEKLISITKPTTYTVPGNLIDQKIHTDDKVSILTKSRTTVKVHGIRQLTIADHGIIKTISLLLHKYRNNPKITGLEGGIPAGNLLSNAILNEHYGFLPTILVLPESKIIEAYFGGSSYGGADVKKLRRDFEGFSQKPFYLLSTERHYKENNISKVAILDSPTRLLDIHYLYPDLTPDEAKKINSGNQKIKRAKRKIVLVISQIFTDKQENDFIKYPYDILPRIRDAAGGGRAVTTGMHVILDWFLRDLRWKTYKNQINEEKLVELLELTHLKRRARLEEALTKCFNAMKNIGILKKIERLKRKDGIYKYEYTLNQNFA